MMKYYLVEISTGAKEIAGKAIYDAATEDEAIAAFHGKLASAMKSPLFDSELVIVIDSTGRVLKREKWNKLTVPEHEESVE